MGNLRQRKGVARIEAELGELDRKHAALVEACGESESIPLLQKENKRLQEELKKLNSLLTDFVELRRQGVRKQKSISNLPRPEVEMKQLDNRGKMLANAEDEYMRVTERISQVSDPQYLVDLKEKIISLEHRIKKAEKVKKTLETEQLKRERKIDKVLEAGEAQMAREVSQLKSESVVFTKKLRDIDVILERTDSAEPGLQAKVERLRRSWKELLEVAEKENVSLGLMEGNKGKRSGASKKEFKAKQDSLKKMINSMKKKYTVAMSDYTQKKSAIQKEITSITEAFNKVNKYFPFS